MIGPKYVMLTKKWRMLNSHLLKNSQDFCNPQVLNISFGIVDQFDATSKVLRFLENLDLKDIEINVFTSTKSSSVPSIQKYAQKSSLNFNLKLDIFDISPWYSVPSVGIGAGGISSLERCSAGVPSINFALADNQLFNSQILENEGVALNGGPISILQFEQFDDHFKKVFHTKNFNLMRQHAMTFLDGQGANRFWNRLRCLKII